MSRTLTITIDESWQEAMKSDAQRAFAGEAVGEILSFSSPDLFFSKLTPKRLGLLKSMQGQSPMSIREIARRVGRDVRRVHDDIQVMLDLGLIEKTPEGRIVCPYGDIHVDMHLIAA